MNFAKVKAAVIIKLLSLVALFLLLPSAPAMAKQPLRILTWEGYVTNQDLANVNAILAQKGYDFEVTVMSPYAESAEQMYGLMRKGEVDISFLTLFFIKMQGAKSESLLQPVNVDSPRLSNYKYLLPALTRIPMGMLGKQPLYIPFAGGSYGFYINRKHVALADEPESWKDLFSTRWERKYSLNRAQIWYNVAIASMALGKPPYYLNSLALEGKRNQVIEETRADGQLAGKLLALYKNSGDFWVAAPKFLPELDIVSSWGMEVKQANREGGNWQLINFREGNLVWMDTINFSKNLAGKRLEAAEIIANYFIGKEVQSRVASELSLVSVSKLARSNPILKKNPKFFSAGTFVPPYNRIADNLMTQMSNDAFKKLGIPAN
jgi:spermidine/putrescine transport system substrate-binding protein